MEFEWTNGRVLSQITVNPTDPNGTADVYSYTYDESGIRSGKTVNGVTTYFTTKDGVILSQTDGTNTMYFQYDNSGNPAGFLYNGAQYFYLTNQMGDVIGITDNTGSLSDTVKLRRQVDRPTAKVEYGTTCGCSGPHPTHRIQVPFKD